MNSELSVYSVRHRTYCSLDYRVFYCDPKRIKKESIVFNDVVKKMTKSLNENKKILVFYIGKHYFLCISQRNEKIISPSGFCFDFEVNTAKIKYFPLVRFWPCFSLRKNPGNSEFLCQKVMKLDYFETEKVLTKALNIQSSAFDSKKTSFDDNQFIFPAFIISKSMSYNYKIQACSHKNFKNLWNLEACLFIISLIDHNLSFTCFEALQKSKIQENFEKLAKLKKEIQNLVYITKNLTDKLHNLKIQLKFQKNSKKCKNLDILLKGCKSYFEMVLKEENLRLFNLSLEDEQKKIDENIFFSQQKNEHIFNKNNKLRKHNAKLSKNIQKSRENIVKAETIKTELVNEQNNLCKQLEENLNTKALLEEKKLSFKAKNLEETELKEAISSLKKKINIKKTHCQEIQTKLGQVKEKNEKMKETQKKEKLFAQEIEKKNTKFIENPVKVTKSSISKKSLISCYLPSPGEIKHSKSIERLEEKTFFNRNLSVFEMLENKKSPERKSFLENKKIDFLKNQGTCVAKNITYQKTPAFNPTTTYSIQVYDRNLYLVLIILLTLVYLLFMYKYD